MSTYAYPGAELNIDPNAKPGRSGENLRFPLHDEVFAKWTSEAECGATVTYECNSGAHLAVLDLRNVVSLISQQNYAAAIDALRAPAEGLVEHDGIADCSDPHCICGGGGSAECEWDITTAHSSIHTVIEHLNAENGLAAMLVLATLTQECFAALVDQIARRDQTAGLSLHGFIRELDSRAPGHREVLRLAHNSARLRSVTR